MIFPQSGEPPLWPAPSPHHTPLSSGEGER